MIAHAKAFEVNRRKSLFAVHPKMEKEKRQKRTECSKAKEDSEGAPLCVVTQGFKTETEADGVCL